MFSCVLHVSTTVSGRIHTTKSLVVLITYWFLVKLSISEAHRSLEIQVLALDITPIHHLMLGGCVVLSTANFNFLINWALLQMGCSTEWVPHEGVRNVLLLWLILNFPLSPCFLLFCLCLIGLLFSLTFALASSGLVIKHAIITRSGLPIRKV